MKPPAERILFVADNRYWSLAQARASPGLVEQGLSMRSQGGSRSHFEGINARKETK
jgi:hypothetical protein